MSEPPRFVVDVAAEVVEQVAGALVGEPLDGVDPVLFGLDDV
jgi:hypothetical protein